MVNAMPGMGAPQMAPAEPSVDQLAAFEQMREQVSPTEINREMLMTAEQADPVAVAEFRKELAELEVAPEVIDMLNTMVDEVLANPNEYPVIRQKYLDMGVDEEILPEAFDAGLFAALNIALDELRGPENMLPPQGFAKGGIASLNPMAREMAEAGRYGDTMLAHISPVEAQILRRYGGSGTINPMTGMPEFFLKKMFKKLGKAVKKFANTTIGKIVIGTALFMVAGPAAASMLGGFGTAAVAAGQGFAAGAGTTLLSGGNLKDSLKAGALSALTAGAMKGVTQGKDAFKAIPKDAGAAVKAAAETATLPDIGTAPAADTGVRTFGLGEQTPITRTPMGATLPNPSIGSFADFTADLTPGGPSLAQQAAPQKIVSAIPPSTQFEFDRSIQAIDRSIQAPIRPSASSGIGFPRTTAAPGTVNLGALDRASPTIKTPGFSPRADVATTGGQAPRGFFGNIKGALTPGDDGIGFKEGLKEAYFPSNTAMSRADALSQIAREEGVSVNELLSMSNNTIGGQQVAARLAELTKGPNMLRQFGPLAATGLGIMALGGGFEEEEVAPPEGFEDFMSNISPGQRLLDQDPQRYGLNYGGVNTTSFSPQFNPYSFSPPPQGRAKGGSMEKEFPRKTGPINGPGTGTSDDIPAMLSDGEFVFTAKAVRGMGNGSRRAGAKKMYALMRKLEGRNNG